MNFLRTTSFDVDCSIEIENSASSLHAHVTLAGDIALRPGDEVTIHGEDIRPAFGETLTLHRRATVRRAGWLEDHWTRLIGRLEMTELLENSFTDWRKV